MVAVAERASGALRIRRLRLESPISLRGPPTHAQRRPRQPARRHGSPDRQHHGGWRPGSYRHGDPRIPAGRQRSRHWRRCARPQRPPPLNSRRIDHGHRRLPGQPRASGPLLRTLQRPHDPPRQSVQHRRGPSKPPWPLALAQPAHSAASTVTGSWRRRRLWTSPDSRASTLAGRCQEQSW